MTESTRRAKRTKSFKREERTKAATAAPSPPRNPVEAQRERRRFTLLLQAVARLYSLGHIDRHRRGVLKDLVLAKDESVMATLEAFEFDSDADEMLDTLLRIAARA